MKVKELTQAERKDCLIRFFADMITTVMDAKDIGSYKININAVPRDCEDHSIPKEINYKMDLELTRGNK